ncbi:hypothetical protein [Flagellimonas allohymeniacidonis]|uniref:Periplasmic heavy metal sensor n=1 Tax=Flagellimonas allohymeniacidonis TaxID=2517819 RepID=A0A4V2HSL1_9FLAO|nr:hypothetical protein [Allomuricauda hymeniacidonis]TAI48140.1 hypothetical protein EW142_15970 [Allomuricauda hymeniacidonis]
MKQFVVLAMVLSTFTLFAQHPGPHHHRSLKADMSAEQLATLHTKKLTLALDLTEDQQKKVMEISLEEVELRKSKREAVKAKKESGEWTKPTSDERFEMENNLLDHQIAHQQKMKEVLNEDQYQTWKKLRLKRAMNGKKRMQKEGRRG